MSESTDEDGKKLHDLKQSIRSLKIMVSLFENNVEIEEAERSEMVKEAKKALELLRFNL